MVGRPSWKSVSDQNEIPDAREWSVGPHVCLGVIKSPPGSPLVVGMPSRMSANGQKASRKSASGRNAIPDVREWSGGPPGCQLVVGRFSRMSVISEEALQDVWE